MRISFSRKMGASVAVVAAMGLVLALLSRARADSLGARPPEEVSAPAVVHRVVGMPSAGTVVIQHINVLGLADPTQAVVEFAAPDGTVLKLVTDTLPAESIYIYTGPNSPAYQARVDYDQAATGDNMIFGVNLSLSDNGNLAYPGLLWEDAAVSRQTGPSTFGISVPFLRKGSWTSGFSLQNRSQESPANLAVIYYDLSGVMVCPAQPAVIPPNGSLVFYLGSSTSCLSDGFTGSAFIASDQPVAVVSVIDSNAQFKLRGAYEGVNSDEASTMLVMPALFKANDLQTSTLCAQNVGSGDTNVSVEYSDGLTRTSTLLPFQTWCLDQGLEAHATGWAGGAVIRSSGEPLVSVANVIAYNGVMPVGQWMYTGVSSSTVDQALALPLLVNDYEDWTSRVYLYNPDNSDAVLTPRYVSYPDNLVDCAKPITVPAGSLVSVSQGDLPSGFVQSMAYFSMTRPVAAVVAATVAMPLGETDRHFGYRAAYPPNRVIKFPDTCGAATRQVFLPVVVK